MPKRGGKTIAVMPLDNQTNSVAGTLYMREEMVALLKFKGYVPMPIEQIDQQLANLFGISMGGQVTEPELPKIAAGLGVDAIMVGTLKTFSAVLLSYNEVSASFALYTEPTWQRVWSFDGTANAPFSPMRHESLGNQLIGGLISNVFDRTAGKPMQGAVSEYYRKLQHTLPSGWESIH
ncbi:MAG: GNA1162 family protein [Gallionella sp.]